MKYKNLVFEGGGVKGSAYVGVLEVLDDKKILKNIKNFAGTSVGSLIAGLMACGCSVKLLKEIIFDLDFKSFRDHSRIPFSNVYRFFFKKGWYIGDTLYNTYGDLLEKVCGNRNITFAEVFSRYKNNLIITGTKMCENNDVYRADTVYFSKDTYPDMQVRFAARISASFPFFFEPMQFENADYIDGGLLNNYPITAFDKFDSCIGCKIPNPETVGVKLLTDDEYNVYIKKDGSFSNTRNIKEYTLAMINCLISQAAKSHEHTDNWNRTIKVDTGKISSMNLDITTLDKEMLYENGKIAALKFLEETKEKL